jgi:hypothetical protein
MRQVEQLEDLLRSATPILTSKNYKTFSQMRSTEYQKSEWASEEVAEITMKLLILIHDHSLLTQESWGPFLLLKLACESYCCLLGTN